MSAVTKITCNGCGACLNYKTNSVDYRLVLFNESKDLMPGVNAYTDMMIAPLIEETAHFCGLRCLDLWRDRAKHKEALWSAFYKDWKQLHGRKFSPGVWAIPGTPSYLRAEKEKEFTSAALEAFPMTKAK